MFHNVIKALGTVTKLLPTVPVQGVSRLFNTNCISSHVGQSALLRSSVLQNLKRHPFADTQTRTVIQFTRSKGKKRTVRTVTHRFYRLNWGIWIRTIAGRTKHLWKKRSKRRLRISRHVFCNATQSWMLDKMVSKFWRTPKYYVDDPYEPYHSRDEFYITRKPPKAWDFS